MYDNIESTIKVDYDTMPLHLRLDWENRASNDLIASKLRMEDVESFMAYRDSMLQQHFTQVCIEGMVAVAVIAAALKYLMG